VPKAPKKQRKDVADDSDDDEDDTFTTVGKGGKAMQFTPDGIFKNLQLVQEARGKKVSRLCVLWWQFTYAHPEH
jgi:translation initiation factor 3 subunit C